MSNEKEDISNMNLAQISQLLAYSEMLNTMKFYSYYYTAYNLVVQPMVNTGRRFLDYAQTGEKESEGEARALDRLENRFLAAHIALKEAKRQGINRKIIAQTFFGRIDPNRLTEKEHGILYSSVQEAVNAEVKFTKR